jgi:hypothetical protein
MIDLDITAEVLKRALVKETNALYSEKYRALKAVEHLFPGEGLGKVSEIHSYLKRKGYSALTEELITAKYTSTGPTRGLTSTLF